VSTVGFLPSFGRFFSSAASSVSSASSSPNDNVWLAAFFFFFFTFFSALPHASADASAAASADADAFSSSSRRRVNSALLTSPTVAVESAALMSVVACAKDGPAALFGMAIEQRALVPGS